jgi:hypothetical protein
LPAKFSNEGSHDMAGAGTGLTEVGGEADNTAITFSLKDEDHTLGNALRYILNKE